MPSSEDTIQVSVVTTGDDAVKELADSFARTKKELDELDKSLKKVEEEQKQSSVEDMKRQDAMEVLTSTINKQKAALVELENQYRAGAVATGEYIAKKGQLSTQLKQTEGVLDNLKGKGGGGFKGSGVMGLSYAVQDFTSQINNGFMPALGAIQNNIPSILTMLGAGAGLAGVISILMVGVGLLIQNWDKLAKVMGLSVDEIGASKKSLEELQKKLADINEAIKTYRDENARGIRSQIEEREKLLDSYKKEEDAIKKVREMKTPEEEKQVKERKEALTKDFRGEHPERYDELVRILQMPFKKELLQRTQAYTEAEAVAKRSEAEFMKARQPFSGVSIMEQFRLESIADEAKKKLEGRKDAVNAMTTALREREALAAQAITTGGAKELQDLITMVKRVPGGAKFVPGLEGLTPNEMRAFEESRESTEMAQKAQGDKQKRLMHENEKRILADKAEAVKAKHAADKAEHEAEAAQRKREQFREESGRDFERFNKAQGQGFMGLDEVAARYAGIPASDRPAFEQRRLIPDAAQMLRMQHPQMPEPEVQQRAAQFPEFLRQRYRGMEAETEGAAQMQGLNLHDIARTQGLSDEAAKQQMILQQAIKDRVEKVNETLRHLGQQGRQSAETVRKLNPQTTNFLDAMSPSG